VAVVILVLLTGRFPFQTSYLVEEPIIRRALRGAVGFNTALSPIGVIALVVFALMLIITAAKLIRQRGTLSLGAGDSAPLSSQHFLVAWLMALIGLYSVRFLLLADEVEYLVPLILAIAVATPHLTWAGKRVWIPGLIVIASTASTSLVTVSLLQRTDPWQKDPVIHVSVQPGGFVQDLQARVASSTRSTSEYQAFLAKSEGSLQPGIEDGTIALVPRDTWNYVISLAYGDYYSKSDSVASCVELTSDTLIPGWRVSQPAAAYGDIAAFNSGKTMSCSVVAMIEPDAVIPNQAGATPGTIAGTRIPR